MADFSILNSTKIRPFESKFAENDEFRILMMNLSFRVMNFAGARWERLTLEGGEEVAIFIKIDEFCI